MIDDEVRLLLWWLVRSHTSDALQHVVEDLDALIRSGEAEFEEQAFAAEQLERVDEGLLKAGPAR